MNQRQEVSVLPAEKGGVCLNNTSSLTVGEYACRVIAEQYGRMVEQEVGVLADQDPEYLHQMRVGSRRLRTALQVFSPVIKLPKKAGERQIRAIARTLGALRDLDVQIADIETDYVRQIKRKSEQKALKRTLTALRKQRLQAFAQVSNLLTQSDYQQLKVVYEGWLQSPQFKAIAQLPLLLVLVDLLNPLLSKLLLHPGWLISSQDTSKASRLRLHDLRKTCKYVRYQAEFFREFYDSSFQAWIEELKLLQDNLGKVQDTYVLSSLLANQLQHSTPLTELQQAIQDNRNQALMGWETIRHRYLTSDFRDYLHQLILHPIQLGNSHSVMVPRNSK